MIAVGRDKAKLVSFSLKSNAAVRQGAPCPLVAFIAYCAFRKTC